MSLDIDRFNDLKEKCRFYSTLEVFSNNKDLRCSYKFHNEANLFLTNFLNLITNKKIKDFISEPIVLGKGITPSQYDDEGSYYYLAMSNIKKWKFDIEDCKKVGKSFYDENSNKTIQLNDILLARSGEGTIGKVAIIEDDEVEGIFADFTMRIRLKDYNPTFAYYYFRSDIFQYLVYTHKKGLGNNTNIFPSQVQEFPLLDFTKEHQNRIVKEVQKQLKDLEFVNDEIEKKRNEILKIVQKAITPNK